MDTDSLIMNIKTKNLYKDIIKNNKYYDLSEYTPAHPIYNYMTKYCNKHKLDIK